MACWLKYFLYLLLSVSIISCAGPEKNSPKIQKQHEYHEVKVSRVMFNFDQSFEIKEVKKGTTISDVHVSGIGFAQNQSAIKIADVNPIESFLVADIDADGFEELYLITRSLGAGRYGKIIGITSNKGKAYRRIYVPEYDKKLNLNFEYLIGYKGHDSIYVENKILYREFPIFKKVNGKHKPSSDMRKLTYKLIEYNESFTLQVGDAEIVKK